MSSTLKTNCPECERNLRLPDSLIGKKVRCPNCRHSWEVTRVAVSHGNSLAEAPEARETVGDGDGQPRSLQASAKPNSEAALKKGEPERPQKLGRFEIKKTLGGGAFGVVYQAWDPTLRRMIALKVPKFGSDEKKKLQRFLNEAHAAANLHHPNIVAVFESGQIGNKAYIASEFVEGTTLSEKLTDKPTHFDEIASHIQSLANGLAYAHKQGIVHRDIKSDNIMVGPGNRPQLTDFGLAKLMDDDSGLTKDGGIMGTPAYMAPEQARGDTSNVGPHSDQYSLGVVLYELLTGQRPFKGAPHTVILQVTSEDPPNIQSLNKEIPDDLAAVCQMAMEKEIGNRYPDMSSMAEDLVRWRMGHETFARPLSWLEKGRRWYKKNKTVGHLWFTVATLAVLVGILGTFDYVRTKVILQDKVAELSSESTLRLDSERAIVVNEFERGRSLCESAGTRGNGSSLELSHGLLQLADGLNNLTPEMDNFKRPMRNYIGSWLPLVHQLKRILSHQSRIYSVAVSDDGKRLLTGSDRVPESRKGQVLIWNLETGERMGAVVEHDSGVNDVDISPDGTTAASASGDALVKIFDSRTGEELREPIQHPSGVNRLAFSADGKLLATACSDENVRIWNTETWELVAPLLHHPRANPNMEHHAILNPYPLVNNLTFTPDGAALLTETLTPDHGHLVRMWELSTGKIQILPKVNYSVSTNSFTNDGKHLATQTIDDSIRIVEIESPDKTVSLINNYGGFSATAFSRKNNLMVMGGRDRSAWVFDLEKGQRIGQILRHDGRVRSIAIAPDGKTIFTAGDDKLVKIWQVAQQPWGISREHFGSVDLDFLSDGESFLTGDSKMPEIVQNQIQPPVMRDRRWKTSNFDLISENEHGLEYFSAIDASNQQDLYAWATRNSFSLFGATTGEVIGQKIEHSDQISWIKVVPRKNFVITGARSGIIRFWNLENQSAISEAKVHNSNISSLTVSPEAKYLVSGSDDKTARIWDLDTRQPIGEPLVHDDELLCAAFHPDGNMIATAGLGGSVYFWTIPEGKPIRQPIYNIDSSNGVASLEFTHDGLGLWVVSRSRGTQLWDLASSLPASRLMFDGSWWGKAAFSPDHKHFICWGFGYLGRREVQLWNLPSSIQGSPETIRLQLEVHLGTQLEKDGKLTFLDATAWEKKRSQLAKLKESVTLAP